MARGMLRPLPGDDGKPRGYRLKYDASPDPSTGARRQRTETVTRRPGETLTALRKRAERRLADALAAVADGVPATDRQATLAAYLTDRWLPHYRTLGKRPATVKARAWAVATWIIPHLGAVKLGTLKAWAIQDAYARMRAAGLAPGSLGVVHATLRQALGQAVKWDVIARNPCAGVDLPAITPLRPPRVLTPAEADALLTAARERQDRYADLYELALLTQLRVGELAGLRWQDVDLAVPVVRVEQSASGPRGQVGPPKTKGSRRIVWLGERARELIAALRLDQQRRRALAGDRWREAGTVFDRGDGRIVAYATVYSNLRRSAVAAGLGPISPHLLRHTGLTWLGQAGVHPFVAGDRAGHASIGMTRHYTHLSARQQSESAAAIERLLHGERSTPVTTPTDDDPNTAEPCGFCGS